MWTENDEGDESVQDTGGKAWSRSWNRAHCSGRGIKHSEAELVQNLSCLVEGIVLNRTWFGVLGFVSWPRLLFPSLMENWENACTNWRCWDTSALYNMRVPADCLGPFMKEYYSGVCYNIYIHHTLASWGPTFSVFSYTWWVCPMRSCTQCLPSSSHRPSECMRVRGRPQMGENSMWVHVRNAQSRD